MTTDFPRRNELANWDDKSAHHPFRQDAISVKMGPKPPRIGAASLSIFTPVYSSKSMGAGCVRLKAP